MYRAHIMVYNTLWPIDMQLTVEKNEMGKSSFEKTVCEKHRSHKEAEICAVYGVVAAVAEW